MNLKARYKNFVGRYLTRGAVGVSVGLAAIASSATKQAEASHNEQPTTSSFSERLSNVRAAVSEYVEETQQTAQVVPRPFANAQPFKNFFGKQPFHDTWKNTGK